MSQECNGMSLVIISCRTLCDFAYTLVVAAMLALAEKVQYKIKLRDSFPDEKSSNKHIRQWIKEETSLGWFYKRTHPKGLSGNQSRVGGILIRLLCPRINILPSREGNKGKMNRHYDSGVENAHVNLKTAAGLAIKAGWVQNPSELNVDEACDGYGEEDITEPTIGSAVEPTTEPAVEPDAEPDAEPAPEDETIAYAANVAIHTENRSRLSTIPNAYNGTYNGTSNGSKHKFPEGIQSERPEEESFLFVGTRGEPKRKVKKIVVLDGGRLWVKPLGDP